MFNNQKYGIFSLSIIVAIMFYMLIATAQAQEPLPIVVCEVQSASGGFDRNLIRDTVIGQMMAGAPVNRWTIYDQRHMRSRDQSLPRLVLSYRFARTGGNRNSRVSTSNRYFSGSSGWGSETLGGVLTLRAVIYGPNGQILFSRETAAAAGENYPTYASTYMSTRYVSGGTSSSYYGRDVARFSIEQQIAAVASVKLVQQIADWRATYRPESAVSDPIPLPAAWDAARGGAPAPCLEAEPIPLPGQAHRYPAVVKIPDNQLTLARQATTIRVYYMDPTTNQPASMRLQNFAITPEGVLHFPLPRDHNLLKIDFLK